MELFGYKYLTSSQFVKIGLFKRREGLTKSLKKIINGKYDLIDKHDYSPLSGKVESLYFLKSKGKNLLINDLEYESENIKIPIGLASSFKDYYYRRFTIDFYISLNTWINKMNGKIIFLDYYFDKKGNNRLQKNNKTVTPINQITLTNNNSFIPDINTMFEINDKKYFIVFEQHNGKDTQRLYNQLLNHILALSEKALYPKYDFKKSHKVIIVCEEEIVKLSVIKRLNKFNTLAKKIS